MAAKRCNLFESCRQVKGATVPQLPQDALQRLLLERLVESEMNREVVLQYLERLNADDQAFQIHELGFAAYRQDDLHPPAKQQSRIFLAGDTDEKG